MSVFLLITERVLFLTFPFINLSVNTGLFLQNTSFQISFWLPCVIYNIVGMLISLFTVIFCDRLPNRLTLDWQNVLGDMKSCFCF